MSTHFFSKSNLDYHWESCLDFKTLRYEGSIINLISHLAMQIADWLTDRYSSTLC